VLGFIAGRTQPTDGGSESGGESENSSRHSGKATWPSRGWDLTAVSRMRELRRRTLTAFRSAHRLSFASNAHSMHNNLFHPEDTSMARKYSKGAQRKVKKVMKERKRGTLKSGRSGMKVKSRKQAIAIGLSEARRAGKKVPKKKSARGSH
jgi:Family of unknown function (DUF6496)